MADSQFNLGKYSKPLSQRPARPGVDASRPAARPTPPRQDIKISCRATNPLSLQDDLGKVFLDANQAKATTATRLFRNDELFNATKTVLGEFLQSGKSGKFAMWSTGCSSGEEVYSMAMIALHEFERNRKTPQLEAFGTDINRDRIAEARQGIYGRPGKDAFAANYWQLLNKYADVQTGEVQMGPALLSTCKFMLFDMRNKPKKHTFHFIVCNHVLQYYDAPGQRHIIGNLKAVLKPGGYLYLEGVTEHGLDGLDLKKTGTVPNLYSVVEKQGGLRGMTRRFFKK